MLQSIPSAGEIKKLPAFRSGLCWFVVLGCLTGIPTAGQAADRHDPATHWAYQPIRTPAVPWTKGSWANNPIDAFIAARHAAKGLTPRRRRLAVFLSAGCRLICWVCRRRRKKSKRSSPIVLPTHTRNSSIVCLLRRITASAGAGTGSTWPAGRNRKGYESNHPHPYAWRYRDYVVRGFNRDKPYPQFRPRAVGRRRDSRLTRTTTSSPPASSPPHA